MPTDPGAPFATDTPAKNADKLAELERRIDGLERGVGVVRVGNGPPPADAREPFYIDATNHKAYALDATNYFILN